MYNGDKGQLSECEEKLLEVSMDEEGRESVAVRRGDKKVVSRVGEGTAQNGEENRRRSGSIRRGVSGLVRKVSMKVVSSSKGEKNWCTYSFNNIEQDLLQRNFLYYMVTM